jgi:hypothetical protein
VGGDDVQDASVPVVLQRRHEQVDHVVDVDPRHPLIAGAQHGAAALQERAAEEVEGGVVRAQHDAGGSSASSASPASPQSA